MTFEADLFKLFEDADGVDDTIWYDPVTTLYEEIVNLHNSYLHNKVVGDIPDWWFHD